MPLLSETAGWVESEIAYCDDDLRALEKEISISERAPLEHRLVDEVEWRAKLGRLRSRRLELLAYRTALLDQIGAS